MVAFEAFDQRGYRTVDARRGYAAWAATYEQSVEDEMDLALLDALESVAWPSVSPAADLACGTGRTGAWLRARGVPDVDGVDATPEMLELARARGAHRELREADVAASGLPGGGYGAVVASLVDEHLADLRPLYREAARLLRPGGRFVLVGIHPHFVMASGMPTHFDADDGEPVAIVTHVHHLSEQVAAGLAAGLRLVELRERIIDDAWVALKPSWERFRGHPISFAMAWAA
ncbi:MAG TPA: class I SAM-dependent methyltransferase [Capillimicrobium sp.]